MTIESDIEMALFARVTSLALSPVLPIAWPNNHYEPPADGKYLKVAHFPNGVSRYSLGGADASQRIGLLQLTVITPLNKGPNDGTTIVGDIAAHFTADLAMYSGTAKVTITKYPEIAPAIKTDASWDIPVTISYQCNSA